VLNEAARSYVSKKRDRPYFLYYPMLLIHGPRHLPPGSEPTAEHQRRLMIEYADRLVGRLVEAVAAAPGGHNTVVMLMSDNGAAGSGKSLLTDSGTRLPCVITWPSPDARRPGESESTRDRCSGWAELL
jgi:arylsulfatase A-like enzyme